MRLSASLAVALLLLYSQFASAQQSPQFLPNTGISIERAVIEADLLHVNGTTLNPGTVVTLDGQFMTTTGADRKFDFSVDYLPETCVIEIRTGSMADPVVVRPCGMERGKDQSAPIPKGPVG